MQFDYETEVVKYVHITNMTHISACMVTKFSLCDHS